MPTTWAGGDWIAGAEDGEFPAVPHELTCAAVPLSIALCSAWRPKSAIGSGRTRQKASPFPCRLTQ